MKHIRNSRSNFVFPWENGILTTYTSEADEMRKVSHYRLIFVKHNYRRGRDIITIQFVLTTGRLPYTKPR